MEVMAARGSALIAGFRAFLPCGSLRLAGDEGLVEAWRARARRDGVTMKVEATREAARSHPLLEGAASRWALRFPTDGVVDPAALCETYVRDAAERGVRVVTGCRVDGLAFGCGRLNGIETSEGKIRADWVVNAAGAWAGDLGERLGQGGLQAMKLQPYRRHIFESPVRADLDPSWPFVWDLAADVYARVQKDRLVTCACDADPQPAGTPDVSPAARRDLEMKMKAALPAAASYGFEGGRACLRTFAPDRRYVIGPDARLPGFFWVAGLGGTGATAGAAIGELAADLLLTGGEGGMDWTREAARWFDPARLTGGGPGGQAEGV